MSDNADSAHPSFIERGGTVGVFGATSLVGACLLPLLSAEGWQITAFSRQTIGTLDGGVEWQQLPLNKSSSSQSSDKCTSHSTEPFKDNSQVPGYSQKGEGVIPQWIFVTPIWVVPDYFDLLEAQNAQRVVVLSSTSRFTKDDSTDPEEQAMALRLVNAEARVREWAESRGVEWVILRPTLIYGLGKDKNIAEIARFIRRFGFFPLFGKANGLRQPIHATDVANACLTALQAIGVTNRTYNISGGETLAYRDMIARVFSALGRRPRLLTVPLWAFRLAVSILRCLPRYRKWSAAMAERMNRDMVFDQVEVVRDLDFKPRAFMLSAEDLLI
ncbi:MAG TPA: NAD(P)-dependent oxidoreductase [Methylobacter sp.]